VIAVRPAEERDLAAVQRIYAYYVERTQASFEERAPDVDELRARLLAVRERGLPYLVAEEDGAVVGYGYCTAYRGRAAYRRTVEDSVYLEPGARGRGVGRGLLEALLAACAAAGVREVVAVIADTGDPASVALHRRCGFREAGRLHGVGSKHGRFLDTVLMQRSLRP
jgi:L-amino acid N-acyltransferase YncA